MTWVRIDDTFPEHPKVLEVGGDAAWLHVCGLAYCARNLTDGLIHRNVVRRLSDRKSPINLANALVNANIWDRDGDDYRVHDYLKYNPSRDQVESERAARSTAKSKAGKLGGIASGIAKRKHDGKQNESTTEANGKQTESKTVAPTRPDPTHTNKSSSQLQVRDTQPTTTTLDQRVADAIELHARTSAEGKERPGAYAATVRNNTMIEHGTSLAAYCIEHPDSGSLEIVQAVLGSNSHPEAGPTREAWYADPHCEHGCDGTGLLKVGEDNDRYLAPLGPCPCRRPEPYLATVTNLIPSPKQMAEEDGLPIDVSGLLRASI